MAIIIAFPSSCQKEYSGPAQTNTAPIVFAGNDTSVVSYDFNMRGEIEDKESNVKTIEWSQYSGVIPAYLVSPTSVNTPAVFTQDGVYQFILTATDAGGLSDRDTVRISVIIPNTPGLRDSVVVDSVPWTYSPICAIVVPDIDQLLPVNKDFEIRVRGIALNINFSFAIPEKNNAVNSNDAYYVIRNNALEIYFPNIDCLWDTNDYYDVSISWEP